jgi:hypothetical protein
MRLIPPGNVVQLLPMGGTFTRNADGSVDVTDAATIGGLLSAGWLPSQSDLAGTGSPEGVITAAVGTEYRQTDGTTQTALWYKASGTGKTGWIAFGEVQVRTASITLNKDGTGATGAIVGTAAGSLGHASGVALVAAVTGKIIVPLSLRLDVTFAVAAASIGTDAMTTAVTKENSFQLAASGVAFAPMSGSAANALHGVALALKAASAFTQPGTAAGTAVVTVSYILV